jgi:hypothetical protein
MIERLNFYDVYGYLLPGLALLGVAWFPFSFVAGWTLPGALSSALFALVVAYVAGHLLQGLVRTALPQQRPEKGTRLPSDYLLDENDPGLTNGVRTRVIDLILAHFSLDVGTAPNVAERTARRKDAFLLCRRALIQQKAGSYAEQFQGMYALMRGLAAVAALSASYHFGWSCGRLIPLGAVTWIGLGLVGLALVGVGLLFARRVSESRVFWALALALLPLGAVLSSSFKTVSSLGTTDIAVLLVVALSSLFAFHQFRRNYQYFGEEFAATVYRDFFVLNQMTTSARGR